MNDYENIFTSVSLNCAIKWDTLDDYCMMAYAAIFFHQIQIDHDYQKEPLFTYQKLNWKNNSLSHNSDSFYLTQSEYFSNLLRQNSFFNCLHQKPVIFHLRREPKYQLEFKHVKNVEYAYEFLKERFGNEIYFDEIEEIFNLAKPYRKMLKEKRILNLATLNTKSAKKNQKI